MPDTVTKRWNDLVPGDVIRVKGVVYHVGRVHHVLPNSFTDTPHTLEITLRGPNGKTTGRPKNPSALVELVYDAADAELAETAQVDPFDLASARLQVMLGAYVLGEQDTETREWICPPLGNAIALRLHLDAFHGGATEHTEETSKAPHTHQETL